MGYEGKKTLKLKFADPELDGLEVVTRRPTVEQGLAMAKRAEELGDDENATIRAVSELLCLCLIGWNLENDGTEVPHTADALLEQDSYVVTSIIRAFEENAITVAAPLEPTSSDGEPSAVESLPMVPLSPSLAS